MKKNRWGKKVSKMGRGESIAEMRHLVRHGANSSMIYARNVRDHYLEIGGSQRMVPAELR